MGFFSPPTDLSSSVITKVWAPWWPVKVLQAGHSNKLVQLRSNISLCIQTKSELKLVIVSVSQWQVFHTLPLTLCI